MTLLNFLRRLLSRRKPIVMSFPMDCTHEFKLSDWTNLNSDPRCIHCGKYFIDKILKEQPASHFTTFVSERKNWEELDTVIWKLKPDQ